MATTASAVLRTVRMSPRKLRIVADMIRGMSVESAMGLLQGLPKRGGKLLKQVLVSAIANAEHNDRADVDRLIISRVCVDSGPIFKRWMPRAMGRANRIQQRTSHITVTVTEQG